MSHYRIVIPVASAGQRVTVSRHPLCEGPQSQVLASWCGVYAVCACPAQVLPDDVMLLAEPSPDDLLNALEEAIAKVPDLDPVQQHERVSW